MEKKMTKQRIERYRKLLKEISALEERIYSIESSGDEYVSDVVHDYRSGYPKTLVIHGYGSGRLPRLRGRLEEKTAECSMIEEYIDSIEDGLVWQILTCRYIEGCTVEETAEQVGYSASQVGRILSRFFEKMRTDA